MRDSERDQRPRVTSRGASRAVPLRALGLLLALAAVPLPALALALPPSSTQVALTVPRSYASEQSAAPSVSNSTSQDWSGYATTGGTYTRVAGNWTQPAVACAAGETSYSAFWVGLDGDTTRTVEQTGTESDCQDGSPVYSAWYEMYPDGPVTIAQPVAPGDKISASVTADGNGGFTLTLSDATAHWSVATPATLSRARLGSAEWIAEAPSSGRRTLPLANFGTVTFTNCTTNGQALGANPNLDAISLATRGGVVEAQPSGIASGGTSFSITAQPGTTSGSGGTPGTPAPTAPPYPWWHHHPWWQQGGTGIGGAVSGAGGSSSGNGEVGGFGGWPGSVSAPAGAGSAPGTGSPWPVF